MIAWNVYRPMLQEIGSFVPNTSDWPSSSTEELPSTFTIPFGFYDLGRDISSPELNVYFFSKSAFGLGM